MKHAVALLLLASIAHADEPVVHATLSYTAPGCASREDFGKAITVRLGYDPFVDAADTHVSVAITKRARGYAAHIETIDHGAQAKRDIVSQGSCDEFVRSVVLAVSLAIDPQSFARPKSVAGPSVVVEEPDARPEPIVQIEDPEPIVTKPAPPPTPRPSLSITASAGARVSVGIVPSVSVGPVLRFTLGRETYALLVEAGADLPTGSVTNAQVAPASVRASLLWAGVGACGTPHVKRFHFFACGRIDLGAVEGSSEGALASQTATSIYGGFGALGGASYAVTTHFEIVVRAELLAPFTRTSLKLSNETVWSTPTVAGGFGLMLGYRR